MVHDNRILLSYEGWPKTKVAGDVASMLGYQVETECFLIDICPGRVKTLGDGKEEIGVSLCRYSSSLIDSAYLGRYKAVRAVLVW